MKLTVKVKKQHIEEGQRNDCKACPIALALDAQHPFGAGWSVGPEIAFRISDRKKFFLPVDAQKWIIDFDDGKRVRSRNFTLHEMSAREVMEHEVEVAYLISLMRGRLDTHRRELEAASD
jgi:hypothetical protein